MSDDNSAISVTLKAGTSFDAPWIVVYANNPQEAKDRLEGVRASGLDALAASAAIDLQAAFAAAQGLGARPVDPSFPTPSQQQPVFATPSFPSPPAYNADVAYQAPAPQAAPGGLEVRTDRYNNKYTFGVPGAPACPHGARVLKQGTKRDGSAYTSYICPQIDGAFRVQTDCKAIYQ